MSSKSTILPPLDISLINKGAFLCHERGKINTFCLGVAGCGGGVVVVPKYRREKRKEKIYIK